jgi:hypothetical protein
MLFLTTQSYKAYEQSTGTHTDIVAMTKLIHCNGLRMCTWYVHKNT